MFKPLHLIDRLVEVSPPGRVRAIKVPSYGEQLFEDHFAGFPIMPGVLMVESMVQSAQWLVRAVSDFPAADFPVSKLERVVFSDYVRPGCVLEVEAESDGALSFRGTARVEGKKVASARFELTRRELDASRPAVKQELERVKATFDLLGGRALLLECDRLGRGSAEAA